MSKPTSSISVIRKLRLTKTRRLLGTSSSRASGPKSRAISFGRVIGFDSPTDIGPSNSIIGIVLALVVWALVQLRPPVIHEYVETGTARAAPVPVMEGEAGPGRLPSQVREDEASVRPPAHPAHAGQRDRSFRADRDTAMQATSGYEEPFSPSVAPFARLSALDGIREDYELYLRPSPPEPLPEAVAGTPDRTLFYGRVEVTLRRGQLTALPSPAPDLRLYGYEVARPGGGRAGRARVDFLRDGADNLYARAVDFDGTRVLTFLVDAPRSYFEGT